jgi:hypothetical protein
MTAYLVDEWKSAWRWFSVQSMALAAVLLGAWQALPDELRASLPRALPHWLAIALLALGIAGRLVKQKGRS